MASRPFGTLLAAIVAFLVLALGWSTLRVAPSSMPSATVVVTSDAGPDRLRAESPIGGFDLASSSKAAVEQIAENIVDEMRRRARAGERVRSVAVQPADGGKAEETTVAAEWLKRALQRERVTVGRAGRPTTLHVAVVAENEGPLGPTIEAWTSDGRARWAIVEDSRLQPESESNRRRRSRDYTIQFKTGPQLTRDDSIEDAPDILGRRIGREVFRLARAYDWADEDDEPRFREKLELAYPRDVLIGIGERSLFPEHLYFEADDDAQDPGLAAAEYHLTRVEWTTDRGDLRDIARAVSTELAVEATAPWLRIGLSVGTLLLAVLLWLRVDLWLKGHYSFLTKIAFAIFFSVGVLMIWKGPLHG